MPLATRLSLALVVLVAASAADLRGQVPQMDRPEPFTPLRAEAPAELKHRQAVENYALACFQERNNRFLEAVRLYEQAVQLDPDAAPPYKALVPLYLALDRMEDALAICKKATELDPNDYETWHLYARQLRAQQKMPETAEALTRALACPTLKERYEQRLQIAFDLGDIYEGLQEFDKAEAAFAEVARILDNPTVLLEQGEFNRDEIDVQAAETFERLGRVCVKAGQIDRATEYFVKARDKVKEKDPVRARRLAYNLAEVQMTRGQWAAALRSLDDYLVTEPQGTEAYRAKIKALQQLGRSNEVLPMLRAYSQRDRHNVPLRLLLAEQCGAAGEVKEAESVYLEVARSSPGPEVFRGLFKMYAGCQPPRMELILRTLEMALAAAKAKPGQDHPQDPDAAVRARSMLAVLREEPALVRGIMPVLQQRLQSGPELESEPCFFLGILAARTRQLDAAEQLFRSCLTSHGLPQLANHEAEVYNNLLRVLRLAHKNEAIVRLCHQGLAQAHNTSPVLFHVEAAQALARLGRLDQAEAEINAAVEAAPDPNKLICRRIRAQILAHAQHFDRAEAECQQLLKEYTRPEEVRSIRQVLSTVYTAAHENVRAEEQLQLILQADPNDATANNDLGYIWADQGKNLEEAEKLIRKAIELDRKERMSGPNVEADSDLDNAAYVDSLGWVLFRRGQLAAGRQELEKAVTLPDGIDDPTVWDHLADVCYRQGDGARALAAWKRAVELYETVKERSPDDRYKEIKQKLKLLERDTQP